jgi:hypothetical protein
MITPTEFTLSLALAGVLGAFWGALFAVVYCSRRQRLIDVNTEKAAMWRIENRAYRLVRSPGLEDIPRQ